VVAGAAGGLSATLTGSPPRGWTIPVASAAGPVKGGTLKVAQIGDPPTLDPMSTTADVTATDGQSIFESLFVLDANGVPQPMLATGANWSDGSLTLTMPLRPGVLFHDGTPMTAADVVASLKRWLKLASRTEHRTGRQGYRGRDSNTVVIQLSPWAC
jgi:peptide/nickel transport system substrate-binding protein